MNAKKNASRNLNDDGNSFNDTGIDQLDREFTQYDSQEIEEMKLYNSF